MTTIVLEYCPVARTLNLIGDRWSLLIIRDTFDDICRFKDFQQNLGVARNILSDRLKKLTDAGILAMKPASDGTAYQEYILTDKGEHLFTVIVALRQWGEDNLFGEDEPHSVLIDKQTGKPVLPVALMTEHGDILSPSETQVRKVTQ